MVAGREQDSFAGYRGGVWNLWWVPRDGRAEKKDTNYTKLNAWFVTRPGRRSVIRSSTNTRDDGHSWVTT